MIFRALAFFLFLVLGGCGTGVGQNPSPATDYSALISSSNPVAYWRLGETTGGAGTTAEDSGPNNIDGSYAGTVTLGSTGALVGDLNTAPTFNGTDVYVTVLDNSLLQFTNAMSGSGWIYFSSLSTDKVIFAKYTGAATRQGYYLMMRSTGLLDFTWDLNNSSSYFYILGRTSLSAGSWHHVAATFDYSSGRIAVYLDGQEDASLSTTLAPLGTGTIDLQIGRYSASTTLHWSGSIDEVALWARALSPAEILAQYRLGISGSSARGGLRLFSIQRFLLGMLPGKSKPHA